MANESLELTADALYATCRPEDLPFETTETVPAVVGTVGQDRALNALDFGLQITTHGHNLFVAGVAGTGRTTTALSRVERLARAEPTPPDWCYVYNFQDPYRPHALHLPPGMGPVLAAEMDALVERCRSEVPRVFESDTYQERRQRIGSELDRRRGEIYRELERDANTAGFTVRFSAAGVQTLPVVEGRPLTQEEFEALPVEERHAFQSRGEALQERLLSALKQMRDAEQEAAGLLRDLDRESALFAVGHLVDDLLRKYAGQGEVLAYLAETQNDIVEHLDAFRPRPEAAPPQPAGPPGVAPPPTDNPFNRYRVNVLVTHQGQAGAPIVFERNPTYYNLMGRIDYRAAFGTMTTDFRMVKPGALHRANGGYLILQAHDVLMEPLAWEALKRALDSRAITTENMGEMNSPVPTLTMRPESIPLQVKVILVGTPTVHAMLYSGDEDFQKLFKVKADFDIEMDRTPESVAIYAGFIRAQADHEGLLHFDRTAVARVVEYGSRLREHQERLSTRFSDVADVLAEAS